MKNQNNQSENVPEQRRRTSPLQKRLHETNARLAAIVEGSDDAIIGKDLNGIIISWNKGAERIYGYTEAEAIGHPVSMLAPAALADDSRRILGKIRQGETIDGFETVRVRKDGRQINMSLTISPIRNAIGEIVGSSTIGRDITRRVQDTALIRKQAFILDQIRDSVITTDMEGTITSWNRGASRMFSYTEEEVLGKHISLIYPKQQASFLEREVIGPLKEKGEHECEALLIKKSGEEFHALLLLTLLRSENGAVIGMVGSSVDISASKKAAERVKLAKEEWEQTFDAIPDIVAVIDNQHVIRRANKALASRLGIDRDDLIGRRCHDTICGLGEPLSTCPGALAIATGKEQVEERFVERLKGHYLTSCTPIFAFDGSVASLAEVFRDVSVRRKLERKLREAATTDELTGLLNRRGFFTTAEHQLRVAHREKRHLALLYLDLNNMKEINDRFSHQQGDLALKDMAYLLKKTFRESDIITRLGGDEFAVLFDNPPGTATEQVVSSHLQQNVAAYTARGERPYQLSFSTGVAYYDPVERGSLQDLMAKADALMYRHKQQFKYGREVESWISGEQRKKRSYNRLLSDERWWAELAHIGKCKIINISAKGVCVETDRSVDVGSRHRITIHSPHWDICHEVVVIWCHLVEPVNKNGALLYAVGMSIVSSEEDRPHPASV
jgi:diguanylate cyclase (GGDEF)-like protein/PAS domain S-box-containing protein